MNISLRCTLFVFLSVALPIVISAPAPHPDYYGPDARSNSDGTRHSATVNLLGHRPSNQDAIYASVHANGDSSPSGILLGNNYAGAEVGVHRTSGDFYNTHFLSAAYEVGSNGAMGRATIADATIHGGGVEYNTGVGFDTGGIYKDGNVEVKVVGIGGKIGKDGIQGCFIVCFGINWG